MFFFFFNYSSQYILFTCFGNFLSQTFDKQYCFYRNRLKHCKINDLINGIGQCGTEFLHQMDYTCVLVDMLRYS